MTSTIDTQIKQERLLQVILQELTDLPPLPAVVTRIMHSINDPTTSAHDLDRLISTDQMLSSQILRLVNSSYYGFPRRVSVVSHAIVILGFNAVRNLVTAVGVGNAFKSFAPTALAREQFWAHSVAVGVCAKTIAQRRKVSQVQVEEVFMGGLLHDIGKLFLDQYFPDQYKVTLKFARANKISLISAEQTALGVRHVVVGKMVAEKWNFPPSLVAMIALHHHPSQAKDYFERVAAVHAANHIARKLALGDGGDSLIPPLDPQVAQWLNFTPSGWQSIETETLDKFEKAKDMVLG